MQPCFGRRSIANYPSVLTVRRKRNSPGKDFHARAAILYDPSLAQQQAPKPRKSSAWELSSRSWPQASLELGRGKHKLQPSSIL